MQIDRSTCSFIDCLFSNMFLPTVTCPTRITETSATLIDNIITNVSSINPLSSIVYSDISDHLSVYLSCNSGRITVGLRGPGLPERPGGPRETSVLRGFKGAFKRPTEIER